MAHTVPLNKFSKKTQKEYHAKNSKCRRWLKRVSGKKRELTQASLKKETVPAVIPVTDEVAVSG
jgi:hypothetical protein